MSRLKNAPLLEVIFELRWDISSPADWEKYTYLQGDLYSQLREKYPKRELLAPVDIPAELLKNKAVYRFRSEKDYPLFQVGPGLLTFNTTDEEYDWVDYFQNIQELLQIFFELHPFQSGARVTPSLSYFDFLKVDWQHENVLAYLNTNLNVKLEHQFHDFEQGPVGLNIGLRYKTALGALALRVDAGANKTGERGIVMQTKLDGEKASPDLTILNNWLDRAHSFSSQLFKDLTKGELYESFK